MQCIQQRRTDGEDRGPDPHERRIPAELRDAPPNDNGRERDADQVRDGPNPGPFSRGPLDGLEVKGQEEDVRVEAHGEESAEGGAGGDGSLRHDAGGDGGFISQVELKADENRYQEGEAEDAAPDFGVAPCVGRSAPLKGEEETYDGADEKEGSGEVHLVDLLPEGQVTVFTLRVLEEDEDSQDGDGTDGKVDPETPSPRHAICKHSADDGSDDGRDAKHAG